MLFCVVMLNLQLATRLSSQHVNTELHLIKTLPLDSMFHESANVWVSQEQYATEILLSKFAASVTGKHTCLTLWQ
jgi:hypothetical protein